VYYNARRMRFWQNMDSGCCIKDAVKSVYKSGICREDPTWPFDISRVTTKPSDIAYTEALLNQTIKYERVPQILDEITECLAIDGFPIILGLTLYDSFMSPEVEKTGIVPMPNLQTEHLQGGHCVVVIGYDIPQKHFIVRNSWGKDWGDNGYCYVPFDYILKPDLCCDLWTIQLVE